MGNNILVTGGAGFIGSHLCETLANLGRDITIIDNLSSGSRNNLRELSKSRGVKLIVGDCKDFADVRKAIAKAEICLLYTSDAADE